MATRSWNSVQLMGNLTRDPELRYTPNGAAVCTFTVATNRSYMVDGEQKEEADFHRCVAWNKLAELCNQLLKKGVRVFVSGRLQTRSWEDAQGQTRERTEVVLDTMIVISAKSEYGAPAVDLSEKSSKPPVEKPEPEEKKEKEPDSDEDQAPTKSEQAGPPPAGNEEVGDDLPF